MKKPGNPSLTKKSFTIDESVKRKSEREKFIRLKIE